MTQPAASTNPLNNVNPIARTLRPPPPEAVFSEKGFFVWCGSLVRHTDGWYYLIYSRWPEAKGFQAWVTDSEVAVARGRDLFGAFEPMGAILGKNPGAWDADVIHNPSVLAANGKYYLYYMGTSGPGTWWDYRNRQRIGLAVASHPQGPWVRRENPVIDISPNDWDALMTSNPSCAAGPDGRFYLLYKGVADGPRPKGGKVLAGMAVSDQPEGPFEKWGPVVENPENDWAVEDGFIWSEGKTFYALMKDFQGYFTKARPNSTALFISENGKAWLPHPDPLVLDRRFSFTDGTPVDATYLERPQLYFENGKARALLCACRPGPDSGTYNVRIPLE